MRPSAKKLISRLNLGIYLVNVGAMTRASAVPITESQRRMYNEITGIHAGEGRHPMNWEPGMYLVRVDQHGNALDVTGMNAAESKAFITYALGGC